MRFASVLLRSFLCLALACNGTAPAFASAGSGPAMANATSAAMPGAPCHGHMAMAATHASPAAEPAASGAAAHKPKPAAGCCESGACACAGAHCVAAIVPAPLQVPAFAARAAATLPRAAGHVAPALPNPQRPPIGQAS